MNTVSHRQSKNGMLVTKGVSPDETLIATENSTHWTAKEVGKASVYWVLIMMFIVNAALIQSIVWSSVAQNQMQ